MVGVAFGETPANLVLLKKEYLYALNEKILNNNILNASNKKLVQRIPVLTLLSINPVGPTR